MRVVNLFGGPGTGKSTLAATLFGALNTRPDTRCELVTEFAKDLVWEKRSGALANQLLVTGQQYERQRRLLDHGVPLCITDSPLLLGCIYAPQWLDNPEWEAVVLDTYHQFDNINLFVRRETEYAEKGRVHSESEATHIDAKIHAQLVTLGLQFFYVTHENALSTLETILRKGRSAPTRGI
jgi:nicotinamide riboside kinase